MVYDEGFSVDFEEYNFFAFSKYTLEKSRKEENVIINKSFCYETTIGWYHNRDKTKWGCYYAVKDVENHSKPTSISSNSSLKMAVYKEKLVEPMRFKETNNSNDNILNVEKMKNKMSKAFPFMQPKHMIKEVQPNNKLKFSKSEKESIDEYFRYLESIPKKFKVENYKEYTNMSFRDLNLKTGRIVNQFKTIHKENELRNFRFKSKIAKKKSSQIKL